MNIGLVVIAVVMMKIVIVIEKITIVSIIGFDVCAVACHDGLAGIVDGDFLAGLVVVVIVVLGWGARVACFVF